MKFSAKIIPGSQIHRLWKEQHRTGGILHGVQFIRLGAGGWVSENDELTAVEVERLKPNPSILIETRGELVPLATASPMPTAQAVASAMARVSPVASAMSPTPAVASAPIAAAMSPTPAPSQSTLRMPQPHYQQHGKNRR